LCEVFKALCKVWREFDGDRRDLFGEGRERVWSSSVEVGVSASIVMTVVFAWFVDWMLSSGLGEWLSSSNCGRKTA